MKFVSNVFKTVLFGALAATAATVLAGCSPTKYAQLEDAPKKGEEVAIITTNYGIIKVRFFPKYAPKAVENFITHAKEGYYDGVIFHRVKEDFMIQGGDPEGTGRGGESIWGSGFGVEATNNLHHIRGALSMANTGYPNSNGSQFFIVQNPTFSEREKTWIRGKLNNPDKTFTDIQGNIVRDDDGRAFANKDRMPAAFAERYLEDGGYPYWDFGYTVFGQVYEGMDVVDAIVKVETYSDSAKGIEWRPVDPVVMESVKIEVYGQ